MTPAEDKRRSSRSEAIAIAIALLAMLAVGAGIAVAGAAPAAKAVKGTLVKKGSEPGNRLILDSVTGKQVKESKLAVVPQAQLADTADSATSADHADSATSAINADAVGGTTAAALHLSCPAGTSPSAGICFETGPARAAATWTAAQTACSGAGARTLPTPTQLEQFRVGAGLTGTEWTNDLFNTANGYRVNMATGEVTLDVLTNANPFRCVAQPVN
jgi:hypothetical protein